MCVKDISMKNHTNFFFDDITSIKDVDPNNIKRDGKSYKNILIYYMAYLAIKNLKYVKFNSVNPLHLLLNKVNGYFEEINENKYLTLVPINENKEKKYEELWTKIRDLIRSVTKNLDDYDEKYIKIELNSNDKLPLNKMIEILVRVTFYENNIYYPSIIKVMFSQMNVCIKYKNAILWQNWCFWRYLCQQNKCIERVWYLSLLVFLKLQF